jgi:hypothetical protein
MCTGCFSWVQTPSVNLGIFRTLRRSRLQRLCNAHAQLRLYNFSFNLFWQYCYFFPNCYSFASLPQIYLVFGCYRLSLTLLLCCSSIIRYEDAFNKFVDEINALAAYQWWEGSIFSILCILSYPLAWSWQQWRRRKKLQRLREFVRSEYDHSCLRSCRSRALYEGLKVCVSQHQMFNMNMYFCKELKYVLELCCLVPFS